jgi:uncharacterized membrane protein YgdD (TMEM256/DUF423 family)
VRRDARHEERRVETRPASVAEHAGWRRLVAAAGALCCAAAIGLGAYAAHGLESVERQRIEPALLYLLVHGLALAVFAPRRREWCADAALLAWALGMLLFCGSLILAVLAGTSTRLAPAGGMLLILGWLLQTASALRR